MNSKRIFSSGYWKGTFLAASIFVTIMLSGQTSAGNALLSFVNAFQASIWAIPEANSQGVIISGAVGNRRDITKGYWYSQQTRDKYCIKFRENSHSFNWGMSRCFDKGQFERKGTDVFELRKETGTLTLIGNLEEENGEGRYAFTEDSTFRKYLSGNNITSQDENLIFHLYLADVDREYIEFLQKNYTQIHGDRLLELAIHGVSQKNYQAYIELFKKYSNKMPSIQEVIEAKIHGIDAAYVGQLNASGFTGLSMHKMMEAKIHGVDADYIEALRKAGFENLSIDQILAAKIHGINSASVEKIKALGYTDLSLDKMIEINIHGVNAAYIQDLEKAGFTQLPINQVIEAKIHGVNADFIQEARSKGYKLESIGAYIELKIHGLSRNTYLD